MSKDGYGENGQHEVSRTCLFATFQIPLNSDVNDKTKLYKLNIFTQISEVGSDVNPEFQHQSVRISEERQDLFGFLAR